MKKINVKKFFNKHWGEILLGVIVLTIITLNFRSGFSILTNDNYSPELNPDLTISRIIKSPAWRSYRSLGVASDSESADLFRAILFKVFEPIASSETLSQGYLLLCFGVGVLSFARLIQKILHEKDNNSQSIFLIAGTMYFATLWTAWVFVFPMMPYVAMFGFLPLLLLVIWNYFENRRALSALKILFVGFLLSTSSLISTLFFIGLGLIIGYTVWVAYKNKSIKKRIKHIFIVVFLVICPNLIWLLSFPSYYLGASSEIVDSSVNSQITESTIDLEKAKMTAVNSSRFYTRLLDINDSNNEEGKMFGSADEYSQVEALKVLSFLPIFFAILGVVFVFKGKKYWLLPVYGFTVLIWFFLKNQNPPLGQIYTWLQNNVNVFRQILRWPTSKFGQIFLIGLGFCSTFGLVSFLQFLGFFGKKKDRTINILSILIVLLQLGYVGYLFTGTMVVDRSYVEKGDEYKKLVDYLEENDPEGRMYILPPANNSYFREYDWGFVGSGFLWYEVPNPILEKALSIGSNESDFADRVLENSYLSEYTEDFKQNLYKYDIQYLLVDRSLIAGRYGYEIDWKVVDATVARFEKLWSKGDLALYKVDLPIVSQYSEVNDDLRNEFMGEGFVSGMESPEIYPSFEKLQNVSIVDQHLSYSIDVDEVEGNYSDNISDLDFLSLPTKLVLIDDDLIVKPGIPEISGFEYELPFRKYDGGNHDYFVIEDFVISRENLNSGYTIDYPYGEISSVFGLDTDDLVSANYKNILDKEPTHDCTGTSRGETVEISIVDGGNFELSSEEGMGCVYSEIDFPNSKESVVKVDLSWSADVGTDIGYCLWSESYGSCMNEPRFFTTTQSNESVEFLVPVTLAEEDNITLTLYVISKTEEESSVEFKNVNLDFLSDYNTLDLVEINDEVVNKEFDFSNVNSLTVQVPIINSLSSFRYNSEYGYVGEPMVDASTRGLLEYWADEYGSNLRSINGTVSYFNPRLNKGSLGKYIGVFYSGQNVEGIPSNICLTYSGDDKCWVQEVLTKDSEDVGYSLSLSGQMNHLNMNFVNSSFSNESENYLSQFILQPIPDGWLDYKFIPEDSNAYTLAELDRLGVYSVLFEGSKIDEDIVAIPETVANGWKLYEIDEDSFVNRLSDQLRQFLTPIFGKRIKDSEVKIDGWKQGWKLDSIDNGNIIVSFYSPNTLGYIGLYMEVITVLVLVGYSIKELIVKMKKNGKK